MTEYMAEKPIKKLARLITIARIMDFFIENMSLFTRYMNKASKTTAKISPLSVLENTNQTKGNVIKLPKKTLIRIFRFGNLDIDKKM